ncbi:MAG: RDD family protein [Planctomycetota bacterium]
MVFGCLCVIARPSSANPTPAIVGSLDPDAALFVFTPKPDANTPLLYRLTPGPNRRLEPLRVPGLTTAATDNAPPTPPTHAAAANAILWFITPEGKLRAATLEPLPGPIPRSRVSVRPFPDLPPGTIPRALVIHREKPYLLARIESPATLESLETAALAAAQSSREGGVDPSRDDARRAQLKRNIVLGLPLDYTPPSSDPSGPSTQPATQTATQPATPPAAPAAAPTTQPTAADRLLVLRPDGWHTVPLPSDWDHPKGEVQLLSHADATHPTLIIRSETGWAIYEHHADAWSTQRVTLAESATQHVGPWSVQRIQGQTIFAWQAFAALTRELPAITLGVLRDDRVHPLGELPGTAQPWTLAAAPDAAAILSTQLPRSPDASNQEPPLSLVIQSLRLDTATAAEPQTITPLSRDPTLQSVGFILLIVIMVSVAAMLALFWRRPPEQQQPQLPDSIAVADLFRRAVAGSIDLAPGFLLATILFDTDLATVIAFWPGNTSVGHWDAIRPGVLVVVLTVLHTTAAETLTQRSLGKVLLGLRVADLQGQPASRAALLLRGLLKPFDLIAWLLLVVPIISPHRQRLADLMSKTVVVAPRPAEPDPTDSDNNPDRQP